MWNGNVILEAAERFQKRGEKGYFISDQPVVLILILIFFFLDWIIQCITCKCFIFYLLKASKDSLRISHAESSHCFDGLTSLIDEDNAA